MSNVTKRESPSGSITLYEKLKVSNTDTVTVSAMSVVKTVVGVIGLKLGSTTAILKEALLHLGLGFRCEKAPVVVGKSLIRLVAG